MIYISPSMLSSDFSRLGEELKGLEQSGADWIHIDVMDGQFVDNITLGAPIIKSMRQHTNLPFDVHLMIKNPSKYLDDFISAGSNIITFHFEAADDETGKLIKKIKDAGCLPSVSIKPSTPIECLLPYLDDLYMVLIMTVEPGFGGQAFIEDVLQKITDLREVCRQRNLALNIQVDGGINDEKIIDAAKAGANAFAVGSAIFKQEDRKAAITALKNAATTAFEGF